MTESPKQAETKITIAQKLGAENETFASSEPQKGTTDMVGDVRPKESVDLVGSQEDITKDQTYIYYLFSLFVHI